MISKTLKIQASIEDSDHQSLALVVFNDNLLTEILLRLPIASILRFKSVSKPWRSLLTHRYFTNRYDNNNNFSKSGGLFAGNIYVPFDVETRSPPPFRSLDFYFNRSRVKILQSSNGLLLCYAFYDHAREYYVFNPTTKQLVTIPLVPNDILSIALAYHQTHCAHYKVVCVRDLDPYENMFQIQVYSSDTRKWKICIESFSTKRSDFYYPFYLNGAVYWDTFPVRRSSNFLSFKLDAERLHMLPMPEGIVPDHILYFGESRGHLHLIFYTDGGEYISRMNVYELLTDLSGWFVKYRLQLDELLGAFPNMVPQYRYTFKVVDVVRGNEEEESFLVLLTLGKNVIYSLSSLH